MKQRFFLSLLCICALVYFALPRLPFHEGFKADLFSDVWLGFCIIAFGGNLAGLLYNRDKSNRNRPGRKPKSARQRHYRRGTSI